MKIQRLPEPHVGEVVNTGRRGPPKPGCDCMQCFGYCITDAEQALRDRALLMDGRRHLAPEGGRYGAYSAVGFNYTGFPEGDS